MIYIASPYSAPAGMNTAEATEHRQKQYEAVRDFQASVFKYSPSLCAVSPIVLWHDAAKVGGMPTDAGPYWEFNQALIDAASKIMVLMLPGWKDSKGVSMEIVYAKAKGYGISYVSAETYIGLKDH